MGEVTGIGWTDHTWSPWWGCTRVSVGEHGACVNCYAEALDKRVGGDHWGVGKPRREMSEKHWAVPSKWNASALAADEPRLVFPSMCDPFDNEVPIEWLQRFMGRIESTPPHSEHFQTLSSSKAQALRLKISSGFWMHSEILLSSPQMTSLMSGLRLESLLFRLSRVTHQKSQRSADSASENKAELELAPDPNDRRANEPRRSRSRKHDATILVRAGLARCLRKAAC